MPFGNDKKDSARRRLFFDDFGSDKQKKPPSSNKRRFPSTKEEEFFGGAKKDAAFSTPERKKQRVQHDEYVPTYIHKSVEYLRRGQAKLSETTTKTFRLVEEYCIIPKDFEQNRKYGTLSGISFEERAIAAYNLGLLEPAHPAYLGIEICSACGEEGHKRDECPKLV